MNKENDNLSVIIPAHNEELYLQQTLKSLLSQKNMGNLEIIVSISPGTTDKTSSIAKRSGCKIIEGGRPATARNNGANIASYNVLFFIDADTYPKGKNFLSKALKEFNERELDLAGTLLSHNYKGNGIKKSLYNNLYNIENHFFLKREKSKKPKQQSGMFIRKNIFFKLNGFKEGIFGEDSELSERAVRNNLNFGILKKCGLLKNSVRRYEKEGFFRALLKIAYLNSKAELFGYDSLKNTIDFYFKK